jgi:hypothetical protein
MYVCIEKNMQNMPKNALQMYKGEMKNENITSLKNTIKVRRWKRNKERDGRVRKRDIRDRERERDGRVKEKLE